MVAEPTTKVGAAIEGRAEASVRLVEAWPRVVHLYETLLRRLLEAHGGQEVGGAEYFEAHFSDPNGALGWALAVQRELLHVPWPAELLADPIAKDEPTLFRGLRVGVVVLPMGASSLEMSGLLGSAQGGQVLVSPEVLELLVEPDVAGGVLRPAVLEPGAAPLLPLWELVPSELLHRTFSPLRVQGLPTFVAMGRASSFIGREAELAALQQMFLGGARLVTIVGQAGCGKTRLVRRFAAQVAEAIRADGGGVWFSDLTEVRFEQDLLAAVARALGISLSAGAEPDSVARLGRALQQRGRALLILDNFDQVRSHPRSTLGRWLNEVPNLQILVTSREIVGLGGEVRFALDPLPQSEAVQLLFERGSANCPGLDLEGPNRALAEDIVKRLHGLPLAIELVAAHLDRPGGLAEIRSLLSERMALHDGDGVKRHGTLRQAIAFAWELLSPETQTTLAQVSIFRSGFSAEAAEAVVDLPALPTDGPGAASVTLRLGELVARSLLRRVATPGVASARYGLLDSVRAFAEERLQTLDLRFMAERRHTSFFLSWGERIAAGLAASPHLAHRLAVDLDNLVAVHQRNLLGAPADAVRAVLVLDPLLYTRGPHDLHVRLLDAGIRAAQEANDPRLQAEILRARGAVYVVRGQGGRARVDLDRARSICKREGFRRLEGDISGILGRLHLEAGAWKQSSVEYEHALEIHREVGNAGSEAIVLTNLATLRYEQGEVEPALQRVHEALALHRRLQNRRYEAVTLTVLGMLELHVGQADSARRHLLEALVVHRKGRDRRYEAMAIHGLALLDLEAGRFALARTQAQGALELFEEVSNPRGSSHAACTLALALSGEGRTDDALSRLADALRLAKAIPDPRSVVRAALLLALLQRRAGDLEAAASSAREADRALEDAVDPWLAVLRRVAAGTSVHGDREIPSVDVRLAFAVAAR